MSPYQLIFNLPLKLFTTSSKLSELSEGLKINAIGDGTLAIQLTQSPLNKRYRAIRVPRAVWLIASCSLQPIVKLISLVKPEFLCIKK